MDPSFSRLYELTVGAVSALVGPRVRLEAADERVRRPGEPEAARVGLVEEDVDAVLPEGQVEVAAVARQRRERLRHEGRDLPVLLGQGVHHVAEEDRPVARDERVGVLEVLLELPVRVFVVVCVVAPAELVAVPRHGGQEVVLPRQAGQVVAGLFERVELVGDLDRAVCIQLDEEVLELDPDLEHVTLRGGLGEHVPQDRARAVGPGIALDRDVAGKARQVGLPRHEREAVEVGHRGNVRIARQLADLAGREPGESGTVLDECVEVCRRDQLRARAAVEVDELREDELDAALVHGCANRLEPGWVNAHRAPFRSGSAAVLSPTTSRRSP